MNIGDIILLVAYLIGVGVTIHFQKGKIDSLKSQIKSQDDIMANMQKFMNIFRLEDVEKYVEINKKIMEKEKEEAIKQIEKDIKRDTNNSLNMLFKEYKAVLKLAIKIIGVYPYMPSISKYLAEMGDEITSKGFLVNLHMESQKNFSKTSNDTLVALLSTAMSREAFWQLTKTAAPEKPKDR